MVAEGAEIGLVDCSAGEVRGEGVVGEHMGERVGLAFHPEAVLVFRVVGQAVWGGFAGVGDDVVVVGGGEGADAWAEAAREEVVPGEEAVVGEVWVADLWLSLELALPLWLASSHLDRNR